MSTQEIDVEGISGETVEEYLRHHPEFFANRNELLMAITLPHSTGGAVSLVERQVALLREQNRRYRRQLQNLVQIARVNDDLIGRLQKLTLELLCLSDLGPILAALEHSLRDDFQADAAALRLFADAAAPVAERDGFLSLRTAAAKREGDELARLLASGRPLCGKLGKDKLSLLFGPAADTIASAAVLPLQASTAGTAAPFGMLAIGSRDADRFKADMDTHYLVHMSSLIGRKLAPCMQADQGS
jgi:uncharacterized protein YigA (DUF484 family)